MRFSFHVPTALFMVATAVPATAPAIVPTGPPMLPTLAPTAAPAAILPTMPKPVIVFWYSLTAFNSAVLLAIADAY